MLVDEQQVLEALEGVMDPELNHNVVELGFIREIDIAEDYVHLDIQLTSPNCPRAGEIMDAMRDAIKAIGVSEVEIARVCQQEI